MICMDGEIVLSLDLTERVLKLLENYICEQRVDPGKEWDEEAYKTEDAIKELQEILGDGVV